MIILIDTVLYDRKYTENDLDVTCMFNNVGGEIVTREKYLIILCVVV